MTNMIMKTSLVKTMTQSMNSKALLKKAKKLDSLGKAAVTVVDKDHRDHQKGEHMMQPGHYPAVQSVPLGGNRSRIQTRPY